MRVIMALGKFQGVIMADTPMGCLEGVGYKGANKERVCAAT